MYYLALDVGWGGGVGGHYGKHLSCSCFIPINTQKLVTDSSSMNLPVLVDTGSARLRSGIALEWRVSYYPVLIYVQILLQVSSITSKPSFLPFGV